MAEVRSGARPFRSGLGGALVALAAGAVIGVAALAFVVLVTNDMRWLLAVGGVLFFVGSLWLGRRGGGPVVVGLLWLPLAAVYAAVVLPELPALWPHLALWALVAAIGGWAGRRQSAAPWAWAAVLAALAVAYAQLYVPGRIGESLTTLRDEEAPPLVLQTLDGESFDVARLEGRVLVLDFFATWCQPCVAELPELEALRADLADRDDIAFLVVANDSGGDTPERIRDFVERSGTTLPFAYDRDGVTHRAFGFAGLPGLAIVDPAGRLRLTREGYNAAERNFRESIRRVLESL